MAKKARLWKGTGMKFNSKHSACLTLETAALLKMTVVPL